MNCPVRRYSAVVAIALLAISTCCTAVAESPLDISSKRQITTADSRHPEVVRADNGNLVVAFSGAKGKGHDRSDQHIMVIVSEDGGKTWTKPIDVYPPDGADRAMIKDPYLMVAPDGTVVCSYDNPATQNTGSISISTDHGRTWEFLGRISPKFDPPCRRFTGGDRVGETLYACGEAFNWEVLLRDPAKANLPISFWKSTDNGRTWQPVNKAIDHAHANEWDVLAISETHFIAVARRYPDNDRTLFFETRDAGRTWSEAVDISPMTGRVHDPNLEWLDRPNGVVLLHGRRKDPKNGDRSALWISRNEGKTWTDYTPVTSRDTRDEYSGFAESTDGRGGYLVWGENAVLYGATVRPR